ncbi:MAG: replicative DNA helicase [Phycisphaerales bacterium]
MSTAPESPGKDSFDFRRYQPGSGSRAGGFGGGTGGRGGAGAPAPLGKLFDREPPCAIEAEMSLLGSMILDPRVIGDVISVIRGADYFYEERHGIIFQTLVELFDKHHTGDLVQLHQALVDRGALDTVGGTEYLAQLASDVPTAANAPHFARIVAEKFKLRRLIDAAGQILYDTYHAGQASGDEAGKLVDAAESRIFEIAQEEMSADPQALSQLLQIEYERLMAIEDGHSAPTGVRCGYYDLDRLLSGFQPGEMIIVAARPSMGKTAFVLNVAEQIAMGTSGPDLHAEREPQAVGIFSLEMSKSALVQRLISSSANIDSHRLRAGTLSHGEWDRVFQTCQHLSRAPIYVDDTPGLTLLQLRARARRMAHQNNVKLLMIDYLQLLSSPQQARESRQVEVSAISRGVKALARELKIPVIALSQLNRGPEGREGNRPRLSDLRESGSLEQDADVVMLLHREAYYHLGDHDWLAENPDKETLAEVIIAKQRNGPTDTVELTWDAHITRFKNHADVHAPPAHTPYRPASAGHADLAPTVPPRGARQAAPTGGFGSGGPRRPTTPRGSLASEGAAPAQPTDGGTPSATQPPSRGVGFGAGPKTGPVSGFRDGGGPDRDDDAPDDRERMPPAPDEPDEPEEGPPPAGGPAPF